MIRIQNVYYMLAYAFQVLNEQEYRDLAAEKFENTAELCAAILACGVRRQIRRGIGKEYIQKTETLPVLRGKIDVSETIKTMSIQRRRLVCTYDEFSVNFSMNQIIKSTMLLLLRSDIKRSR